MPCSTPVLYLIRRTEFGISEHTLRRVIAQWFFMSAVTGRYTAGPESRMESDLAMLRDVTTSEDFMTRLRHACSVTLTTDFWEVTLPNDLATSSALSPSLFAYEAALVLLDAPVLFSDTKVAERLDPALPKGSKNIEKHHLFPRGHLAKLDITETRDVNQIANYAYVEWTDNSQISDQAPAEYLPPLKERLKERFSEGELARMYRYHALPEGWESLNYRAFLVLRRELMAQIVREAYERLTSKTDVVDRPDDVDLDQLIGGGESDMVEFKSTLRVNLHTGQPDDRMKLAVLRTLAGFLNKDGGTLIVGVADDGTPVGLDADGFRNEDHMSQHLANIVNHSMGASVWGSMHANFDDLEDGRVLMIRCEKSRSPVYVQDGKAQRFYVRTLTATTELQVGQVHDYIKRRFG